LSSRAEARGSVGHTRACVVRIATKESSVSTLGSRKLAVGVLFGGTSGEHEVSMVSAKSVWNALDQDRYDLVPIAITRKGLWLPPDVSLKGLEQGTLSGLPTDRLVTPLMGKRTLLVASGLRPLREVEVDVVFPVLHGPGGEDGTVQGLLQLAGIPYVGAGVAASGVGMDKALMKALFIQAGIPVCRHVVVVRRGWLKEAEQVQSLVLHSLGLPCFVKPANLGSSVGISKVSIADALAAAMQDAFCHDRKVIVEEAVEGRELECAVLGNDDPKASAPGEIVPCEEFYSYSAKYEKPSELRIPAPVGPEVTQRVQELAVRAFQAIDCRGMARVDFFLRSDSEVLVNEINTIPGFTSISMYPKLWAESGLAYAELLDRLIELALEDCLQGSGGARERGAKSE
jgi:D-alanine-D-alanine ligase